MEAYGVDLKLALFGGGHESLHPLALRLCARGADQFGGDALEIGPRFQRRLHSQVRLIGMVGLVEPEQQGRFLQTKFRYRRKTPRIPPPTHRHEADRHVMQGNSLCRRIHAPVVIPTGPQSRSLGCGSSEPLLGPYMAGLLLYISLRVYPYASPGKEAC